MVKQFPNLTIQETSSGTIIAKHSNGNAIKFKTDRKQFSKSKSVVRRLTYFDKYGVMVGYK